MPCNSAGSAGRYFLAVIMPLACVKFFAIRYGFFFFHTTLYSGSLNRVLFWARFLANPLKAVMLITVKTIRSINGSHFFTNTTSLAYAPETDFTSLLIKLCATTLAG